MKKSIRLRMACASIVCVAVAAVAAVACSSPNTGDDDVTNPSPDGSTADVSPGSDGAIPPGDGGVDAGREPSIKLAAGANVTCALKANVVKCWGDNSSGQLGSGPPDGNPHATPTAVTALSFTPTMLATSGTHTCASDGTHTSCWGSDFALQLGQTANPDAGCVDANNCPVPIPVDIGPITALGLGTSVTCFISSTDDSTKCFGSNQSGELGPVSVGSSIASPQLLAVTNVVEVKPGQNSVCARRTDGSIWCWGDGEIGTLGEGPPDAAPSNTPQTTPAQVPGIVATQLASGPNDTCVTIGSNTVSCWGENGYAPTAPAGQLGHDPTTDRSCAFSFPCDPVPTPVVTLSNVREVSAGLIATCAVRNDDSVVCWGDNVAGELNAANSVSGNFADDPYNYDPQVMPGLTNVAHIVMGDKHACAVTWDDHVLCWGSNSIGQLGVPTDGGFSPTPVTPTSF